MGPSYVSGPVLPTSFIALSLTRYLLFHGDISEEATLATKEIIIKYFTKGEDDKWICQCGKMQKVETEATS